jgi:hypothetical protein
MLSLPSFSQLRVSGPACVAPGAEYFYRVAGGRTEKILVKVCVAGGVFAGSNETCIKETTNGFKIVWQEGAEKTSITINSAEGDTTIYVTKNAGLNGGEIGGPKKSQVFDINRAPFSIACSPASGGPCNARYFYQWQSSDNCVAWKDVSGAVEENLKVSNPPEQTIFYRRMVVEKISNTTTYSDVATVFIVPVGIKVIDVVIRH